MTLADRRQAAIDRLMEQRTHLAERSVATLMQISAIDETISGELRLIGVTDAEDLVRRLEAAADQFEARL